MVDDVFGELFIDDEADEPADKRAVPISPPVTVFPRAADPSGSADEEDTGSESSTDMGPATDMTTRAPAPAEGQHSEPPIAETLVDEHAPDLDAHAPAPVPAVEQTPTQQSERRDREQQLAEALNALMRDSRDVEAAALVSLDGFAMASALPAGMEEDRVGAMSAAILGLGERAATELGRGKLSQVFIEGDDGYVLLMAAGGRAVLTCLADRQAKLGLVIYDMRIAADVIGEILT